MKAINFVVRTGMGAVQRGEISATETVTKVDAAGGAEVSLNVRQIDLQSYARIGNNLEIVLVDGRVVLIENYFNDGGSDARLFVSADGYLNEVTVVQGEGNALYAQYGPTEQWGKWSPSDDLIFLDQSEVVTAQAAAAEDEVSMLGAGLLGGGGLGLLGGGAAILTGATILGGGSGSAAIIPTVNEDGAIVIGGDDDVDAGPSIPITGTGEPGSTVDVTIGDQTQTTEVDEDGNWGVVFEGDTFPEDGEHTVDVHVTNPDGDEFDIAGPSIVIDTTPPEVDFADGTVSADDITNADDFADGVEIGGTGEAGSTVTVAIDGNTLETVVDENGNWSVTVGSDILGEGEYESTVTVTTTDSFGNSQTYTETVVVDTVANDIVINTATFEGDGTLNATETENGIVVNGTSIAGETVTVTMGGSSQDVVVDENGNWSVTFDNSVLEGTEYDATVTVTSTDAAGNVNTVTGTVHVDTVTNVGIDAGAVPGDGVINASEIGGGVTLTGTAQPGASVEVTVGGVTQSATVDANGNWTATFDSSALSDGELTVTAVATDQAGNTATATDTITVDTQSDVSVQTATVEGDGIVNAGEHSDGVTLTGTTEPGSSVMVTVAGTTLPATVDANGNWTVDFPASALPDGELTVTAVATDAAGNSSTATGSVTVDTQIDVSVETATVGGDGTVNANEAQGGITLTGTAEPGSTVSVSAGNVTLPATVDANGNWTVTFPEGALPDGQVSVSATATDAAGNSTTANGMVTVDTVVDNYQVTSTPGGSDGVVNAAEAENGLVLSGTVEPGSSVTVQLDGGQIVNATVNANGVWTATIPAGEFSGNGEAVPMVVTATDAAGNVSVLNDSVVVDTEAGSLALSTVAIETDGVINAEESLDGVVIRGTSDPGNVVQVTLGGVTHSTVTDANGNWSRLFLRTEIPADTDAATITAVTTDAAGNSRTVTGSVKIDTIVENLTETAATTATDGVINGVERGEGVTLTGTVEPGSTVSVQLGNVTLPATVDANGNWSVDFAASDIPEGEDTLDLTVFATDQYGNQDQTSATIGLDTEVRDLAMSSAPIETDDVINLAEAADGVTLTGKVEAGSTVMVTFGGMAYEATVDAFGNWTVDIPPEAIPAGQDTVDVVISATDAAGNTDSITQSIALDLDAPDVPIVESYTRTLDGYSAISTHLGEDEVRVYEVNHGQPGAQVGGDGVEIDVLGVETFGFSPAVADGSHLIVHSTDDAGNTSGTYLVLDESTTSVVDLSNSDLGNFNIESVDLQFADESQLTITEAELVALSSNTDTLIVSGGVDDTLTITGAVKTTETVQIDNQTHDVYTLGDSATIMVDDDINVII